MTLKYNSIFEIKPFLIRFVFKQDYINKNANLSFSSCHVRVERDNGFAKRASFSCDRDAISQDGMIRSRKQTPNPIALLILFRARRMFFPVLTRQFRSRFFLPWYILSLVAIEFASFTKRTPRKKRTPPIVLKRPLKSQPEPSRNIA